MTLTPDKKKDGSMTFPVKLLWINAALFVLFGAGFIVAPNSLSLPISWDAQALGEREH